MSSSVANDQESTPTVLLQVGRKTIELTPHQSKELGADLIVASEECQHAAAIAQVGVRSGKRPGEIARMLAVHRDLIKERRIRKN